MTRSEDRPRTALLVLDVQRSVADRARARVVGQADLHRGFHTDAVRTASTAGAGLTGAPA